MVRYCLADGTYTIALNDTLLFEEHRKNALVVVTSEASGQNITIFGTATATLEVVDSTVVPSDGGGGDDDSPDTVVVALFVAGGLLVLGIVAAALWYVPSDENTMHLHIYGTIFVLIVASCALSSRDSFLFAQKSYMQLKSC